MKQISVVAAAAAFAVACGAAPVQAHALSLAYKANDSYKYGLHASTTASIDAAGIAIPLKLDVTGDEQVKVTAVDTSGTADVSITVSNLTVKSSTNGITNTTTGMPGKSVEMMIAADGRVLSVNGETFGGTGLPELSGSGGTFISAVLPDRSVKPGDSWSKAYDIANPAGTGAVHITANSRYLRDESLKGVNAAVVETKSTGTFNLVIDISKLIGGQTGSASTTLPIASMQSIGIQGTTSSDTTTWIDPNGHRVMKSHMTGSTTASLTVQASGPAAQAIPGPVAITGTEAMDLTPA
jgi:hypothetical protein